MSRSIALPVLPGERPSGVALREGPPVPDAAPTPARRHALPAARDQPRRLIDALGRTIRDLRLSITDRCNFRCVYCLDPGMRFASTRDLLTVDELVLVARACVALGVERVRLTGGEPTLHPELEAIIHGIAGLGRARPAVTDLSMTTNGSVVTRRTLTAWREAGLNRITFSLDAASPEGFQAMTRGRTEVGRIVDAIRAALEVGLAPVKVNAVVIRGRNEHEIPALVTLAHRIGFEMRFIEYMPLDSGRRWNPDLLVPGAEILALAARAPGVGRLIPCGRQHVHGTCEMYAFQDGRPARVGVIAPVTRPFCAACSRLRVTADGRVRPCLFSAEEFDLRSVLRDAALIHRGPRAHQRAIEDCLIEAVWTKQAGHAIHTPGFRQPDRPMSAIGG